MHLAGPVENGWRVVNVVPSRQESENFAREQLLPALRPQRTRRLRRGSSFALAAWSRFKEVTVLTSRLAPAAPGGGR